MGLDNWLSFSRLKRAIKKVSFIVNFNMIKWRLASIMHSTSQKRLNSSDRDESNSLSRRNRLLSFNDRQGLRNFLKDDTEDDDEASTPSTQLQRSISYHRSTSFVSDEDIDNKAEMFISNFYRHLQIERQVSLELQYCRGNSMKGTTSSD